MDESSPDPIPVLNVMTCVSIKHKLFSLADLGGGLWGLQPLFWSENFTKKVIFVSNLLEKQSGT